MTPLMAEAVREDIPGQHLLLLTAYSDNYTPGGPSAQRNAEYARRHGYGFLSHVLPYETMCSAVEPRTCHWYKVLLMMDRLSSDAAARYEHLVWLDADAVVLDMGRKLHELLAQYPQEVVCAEDCSAASLINTGVLALRPSDYVRRLCEEVWEERRFWRRAYYDQSGLERLLRRRGDLPARAERGAQLLEVAGRAFRGIVAEELEHVAVIARERLASKRSSPECFIFHSIGGSANGKFLAIQRAIAAAGGTALPRRIELGLEEAVTVVVTTSPVPSHPSTALLDHVVASFELAGLSGCRLLIVCDGFCVQERPRPKRGIVTEAMATGYREFVGEIVRRFTGSDRVAVVVLQEHAGFGYAVKAALERVATPLVCVVQHDNAFVRRVNLAPVARALLAGELVRYVGLMSSATADYESLCMSRYGVRLPGAFEVERCKLVPLIYWYDKTHLASVDYYRSLFDAVYEKAYWYLPDSDPPEEVVTLGRRGGLVIRPGDFIEETLGKKELFDVRTFGFEAAHGRYGTYLYDDAREPAFRHMDGQKFLTEEARRARGFAPKTYGPDDGRREDYRLDGPGGPAPAV